MNRWYSIEVIYFATLFLSLDIQTPSSSPTSGEYNVFFYNFLKVSFGANFNWACPNICRIALIFTKLFFFAIKKLFTLPLCL